MWAALTKNLPVKLSSLLIALVLWAMVAGQKVVPREITVPLVLPPLPDSLMLRHPVREEVAVTFLASIRQLAWFRLQPPRMEPPILLMEKAEPDTVWLDPNFLKLPRAFSGEVERIQPPFVMIQLVEVVEKKVPVKAVLGKEPRHPYRLDEASGLVVEPGQVIARGPRRKVSQMPWVRTEFLDLQEETAGGEKELGLEKEDPLIQFRPEKVKVRYKITRWPGS